jgi:hypothetical protein
MLPWPNGLVLESAFFSSTSTPNFHKTIDDYGDTWSEMDEEKGLD